MSDPRFIPVRRLMTVSDMNPTPRQLTDYAQNYRQALIYALCDEGGCTVSTEGDDGIVETFWLQ